MAEIPVLNSQNMKYFFMIATILALACFFLSENNEIEKQGHLNTRNPNG